jgi:16S rRNA (cytosine1402-N4)-methyltransferase
VPSSLNPGGRVAIISFHSGEDRLVKAAFRAGAREGVYTEIADQPLRASYTERGANPRSRSAKLRWARRGE